MAASPDLTSLVDQLVALFNQRSLDLPDGYFTRNTRFLLNGVPFEEMLGRSARDPLVLMLTRGPAGYRFTAKAVQHAVPDASLQRGELEEISDGGVQVMTGQCWLSGHFRGSGEPVELLIDVEFRLRGGSIEQAGTSIDPALLEQLKAARLRP
ncbi:MAG TPA: hypothetical protein VMO26_15650 [Vicinamibacterales bacterium]|nr:hypothetical protein [Vicinamibacterales bacterium]